MNILTVLFNRVLRGRNVTLPPMTWRERAEASRLMAQLDDAVTLETI